MNTNIHTIIIYGPGCARCDELLQRVQQVTNSLPGEWQIRKVTDAAQMAAAGVFTTPGLELDGRLLLTGKVPDLLTLRKLLTENGVEETQTSAPSCACGCSCRQRAKRPLWKQLVLWASILLLLVGSVRFCNSRLGRQNAEPVPAASAATPVQLVYYCFGSRCATCLRMEQWAREAVAAAFADELARGELSFRSEEADDACVAAYELSSQSLVLQRRTGEFRKLARIWELNRDERAFKSYVTEEVKSFLHHE